MGNIITVDLGTTLIKCTLFEESGTILAAESIPCRLSFPGPSYAEQDAEFWYTGVCDAIQKLVTVCNPKDIIGLSISSQGISIVATDENFHPLQPAISWLDTRAEEECTTISEVLPEESLFRRTGKFLSPCYTLPKLLWLKNHRTEVFSKASKFLMPLDYLNACMTGQAVTDHTMAAGTMAYHIVNRSWDPELLSLAGLTPEQMAEIRPAGALVGYINSQTAALTGLLKGTPVFNGGQDQKVAAFAAGIDAVRGSLSLGTAGALEIFVTDANNQSVLPFFPYILPEQTLVECCINTTGAAIQWFKDTLAPELSFDTLNALASASPIGSHGIRFYPHLSRPGTPHHGRSEYGSLHGLSLGNSRGDLFRALYEGLAFEFRLNLETAQRCGSILRQLILFGGASKSPVFCQIIADVTGLEVLVSKNSEMSSIGAAKLVIHGLGQDTSTFAEAATGTLSIFTPDPCSISQYHSLYEQYLNIYQSEE